MTTTQKTAPPQGKKTYEPPRLLGSLQISYMVAMVQAKGYGNKERVIKLLTALSSAKQFGDITFDEGCYMIERLPRISREQLEAFEAGTLTAHSIGLPRFNPHYIRKHPVTQTNDNRRQG